MSHSMAFPGGDASGCTPSVAGEGMPGVLSAAEMRKTSAEMDPLEPAALVEEPSRGPAAICPQEWARCSSWRVAVAGFGPRGVGGRTYGLQVAEKVSANRDSGSVGDRERTHSTWLA